MADLSRSLRLLLEGVPYAPSLDTLLAIVDNVVLEISSTPSPGAQFAALENELQAIYDEVIDHASLTQIEVFLAVLYRLRPILPPSSLISTWFDLVLRPALRDPRLPARSVEHAKELVIAALDSSSAADIGAKDESEEEREKERKRQRDKMGEFRRRLMELYLLDAYNESSGEDVLEWATLDGDQREKKGCWKVNLEDVLTCFGLERPQDFMTEIYHCFSLPSSRLQLFILLNAYTSHPDFQKVAPTLASHPLTTSLLHCLLFDGSSTVAIMGTTVMTKLLPFFAVKASADLKRLLPLLLAVLARIICWRVHEQPPPSTAQDNEGSGSEDSQIEQTAIEDYLPPIHEDIEWERLEQTFHGGASSAPSPYRFFTFLYYLFPCNVIRFMRYPIQYINASGLDSPYKIGWDEVLDEAQIRSKSEPLMRGHVLHPLLIWRGAVEELTQPEFWAQYDIARIVGDCTMLDVRNAALGLQQRPHMSCPLEPSITLLSPGFAANPPSDPPSNDAIETSAASSEPAFTTPASATTTASPTPVTPIAAQAQSPELMTPVSASTPSKPRVSLQDMVATSVALKSGVDIEIVQPSPSWSTSIFPSQAQSQSRSPSLKAVAEEDESADTSAIDMSEDVLPSAATRSARHRSRSTPTTQEATGELPLHIGQALAGLQREVLLLRNELNFELWNNRENVRHIGRLYQDKVLSKNAEVERQGLHNKLREYKSEITRLQHQLREHKEQSSTVKIQYADWNRKMQDKLTEFRNEKKSWVAEAAAMRAADKEAKDTFTAQSKLLAEANQKVFQLETKIKEDAHKVDRLRDYEKQIEQLINLQRLWELDVHKLREQDEYMNIVASKYRKMELRLESYEKTQMDMDQLVLSHRQQIQLLSAQLAISQRQLDAARRGNLLARQSTSGDEIKKLNQANQKLREENADLQDEVEEMKAMVEVLKAQVSERRGLVSEGRASRSGSGSGLQGPQATATET